MLKRLKNLLGIEGVKIKVEVNDRLPGRAVGVVLFYAPESFTVQKLHFKVEEAY